MKVQTFVICYKGNLSLTHSHTHTHTLPQMYNTLPEDSIPVRAYNCNTNQSPTVQFNKKAVKI